MATSSLKKVLIIEDQKEKSQAIRECLTESPPRYQITETDTIVIAGHLLSDRSPWAGVILDLSFRRTHQAARQFNRPMLAGLEILQQMNEMRLPWPVIIATQHSSFDSTKYGDIDSMESLKDKLSKAFPRNYKTLVEVDLIKPEWRHTLIKAAHEFFK
jgi:DNA-binding NtrC family response regulator